ncbi:hypothetical protein ACFE04_013141 [Oxalis oulophora]
MSHNHHNNPRKILTPPPPLIPISSRKRKEREPITYGNKSSSSAHQPAKPLLAGYLAFEFLTKGTLFGQVFDAGRADAVPLFGGAADWRKGGAKPMNNNNKKKEQLQQHQSYADVARILKTDGAYIPKVVNPTQLGRWIGQM